MYCVFQNGSLYNVPLSLPVSLFVIAYHLLTLLIIIQWRCYSSDVSNSNRAKQILLAQTNQENQLNFLDAI